MKDKMKNLTKLLLGLLLVSSFAYSMTISKAPKDARAYIISPADGETVSEWVNIKFGLQGMGVSPAGLDKANTGHHHLIVDGKKLPVSGKVMGSEVMHFGGGQTEKRIKLSKGKHTLQLILGNYMHVPHDSPVVSEKITIFVK